jgi:polysaccharide pyruvyl transferase WcaK-like protein
MSRIIINGFFGKGNCGDEAILQTWYDRLSYRFRIVASVDMDVSNFNRPPDEVDLYKKIDLIHNRRVDIFCREDISSYIIGGGGLGLGFGIEQLVHARLRKKKSFYLGTAAHDEFFEGDEDLLNINKSFFRSFEMISFRDKYSKEKLKKSFGIDSVLYPDIAFGMSMEEIEIKSDRKYITVTIRDNGVNELDLIKKWMSKINYFADSEGYDILFLPFDKTDENLMRSLEMDIRYDNIYWHPKKMKYIISKSEMVFSMGRFHPLVFSISSGVTCYFIDHQKADYNFRYNDDGKDKCYNIMNDFGIGNLYLTNVDLFDDILFGGLDFKKMDGMDILARDSKIKSDEFFDILLSLL